MTQTITIRTTQRTELVDITYQVEEIVRKSGIKDGVCYLFVPHTTAGITINENADPSVRRDINTELSRLIPSDRHYQHTEGNADAHIKSTLINCFQIVLIEDNKLLLGTWQGIFFCEFDGPRTRRVYVKIITAH